jgi:hypothetical protein
MKTLPIGLVLGAVLAARLTLGQEAAPEPLPPLAPPADAPPSEPTAPSPSPEPAPSAEEPTPPATAEFPPPPPSASATAEFPTPPPASASAVPPPTAAPSAAPPPVVPPPPAAEAKSKSSAEKAKDDTEKEDTRDDTHGVFGPFRIGPVIGVGLPAFLSFGGAVKLTKYFGAGITYGIVPTLQFAYYGDATVAYQGVGIYGHIHPFGGGFFLGAGIGYAHVRGTYTDEFDISAYAPAPIPGVNLESFPYTSEATMQTLVLTPELGYFYTFKSGFTMGVEAGIQIPLAPSEIEFKSQVDPRIPDQVVDQYVTPTDERVESTLERVGQTILPTIGIKMGWLF